MKRRLVSLLLVVLLVVSVLPVTAFADAAANIEVKNATYYSSGTLKSITATFDWTSGNVTNAYMILSSKKLNGGDSTSGYGDFTNFGAIDALSFDNYNEALAYQSNCYGFIEYTTLSSIAYGSTGNTMTLNLTENAIPMSTNATYYVYLWVTNGSFYPDNLICVIQVKDGTLQYVPASVPSGVTGYDANYYRNYYDANAFQFVESQTKYSVTVTPGASMTRDTSSGAEHQPTLESAMTPVTYTAANGYYFPETYSVATVNGIMVKRLSDSQIQVYGTPSADASITLTAPSAKPSAPSHTHTPSDWMKDASGHWKLACTDTTCASNSTKTDTGNHVYSNINDTDCNTCSYTRTVHTCTPSDWLYDANSHWRRYCVVTDCANHNSQKDKAAHVYTDAHDATCNTCGYTRTPPAEHPETGDITHIPLWTALFLGGTALLWFQLEQRKRRQF